MNSAARVKPRRSGRTSALGLAALIAAACSAPAPPPQSAAGAAAAPAAAGTVPHGDHNPHHGGIVMMRGDLHYEVVCDRTGRAHHVYFTDAVRDELPAAVASAVTLTIKRPKAPDETVALRIDDDGESWIGSG